MSDIESRDGAESATATQQSSNRKHLYLVTEHEDEDRVGDVKITDTRLMTSEKNQESVIKTFEPDEGFYPVGKEVGLGYVDFESEEEYEEQISEEIHRKLDEIDTEWLEKPGLDPEEVTPDAE